MSLFDFAPAQQMTPLDELFKQYGQQPAQQMASPDEPVKAADSLAGANGAPQAEKKSMAKILESMPAENAARILKDLSDREVKELLLAVKKRQAAKILAALEPDRAARIMR